MFFLIQADVLEPLSGNRTLIKPLATSFLSMFGKFLNLPSLFLLERDTRSVVETEDLRYIQPEAPASGSGKEATETRRQLCRGLL